MFSPRQPAFEADLAIAKQRVAQARQRAREAQLIAARCRERAADVHRRAQRVHERAAAGATDESVNHLHAAHRHRAAAVRHYQASQRLRHLAGDTGDGAEADTTRCATPSSGVPSRSLVQAVAFIEDNADKDIAILDIANAVYLTPRTVQLLFRRWLGCTPMTYLRSVRLRNARTDLLAADPALGAVGAIAERWQFAHSGRFARDYKARFGESPIATLRKSRAAERLATL